MLLGLALTLMMGQTRADSGSKATFFASGNSLLVACGKYDGGDSTDSLTAACLTYVSGLADGIRTYEAILELSREFDTLTHMSLLARVGALPKDVIERLPKDGAWAKTGVALAKLQSEAAAQGAARSSKALEGISLESLIERHVCFPDGVSTGQLALVILKFLRDHPERLHESRAGLAFEALKAAFPCQK